MATKDGKTFLSGVMDLSSSQWLHKSEIVLGHKIYPGELNFAKHSNRNTSILIPSKEHFTLLVVDEQGKEKHQNTLSIQKTGGQHGVQPSTALLTERNSTLVFASSSNGMSGGSVGNAPKDSKLLASLPLSLVQHKDDYYVIVRAELEGFEKGLYTDVSSSEIGDFKITTTNSYRIDQSITAGYVSKINFKKKGSSNVIQIKDLIVSEFPGNL